MMPAATGNRRETSLNSYFRKKWNRDFTDMEKKVLNNLYEYYTRRSEWPASAQLKKFMINQGECGVNSDIAARVSELVDDEVLQYGDEKVSTGKRSTGYRVLPGDSR